jgi:hypothetical protein
MGETPALISRGIVTSCRIDGGSVIIGDGIDVGDDNNGRNADGADDEEERQGWL